MGMDTGPEDSSPPNDDGFWENFDINQVSLVENGEDSPEDLDELIKTQLSSLVTIKKLICTSIMMNHASQRCNSLQSVVGIFLHSCNTSETVCELLARFGLSISTTSINEAVNSLSKEAGEEARRIGQQLMVSYAYDNLDVTLKHGTPTVEQSDETLHHFTTGTLLPLNHGVTSEDLDCSKELWKTSPHNPANRPDPVTKKLNPNTCTRPEIPFECLYTVHAEPDKVHPTGLTRSQRFMAWKILDDLIHHGPDYFQRFSTLNGQPEEVEKIPITKTTQTPLRIIDISPSTPSNNATALTSFFLQAGVGESAKDQRLRELFNRVILVFGDLLTGQHINSLQDSRAQEGTPWNRFQFVVFVLGLFHLKMACADAIWRLFIRPKLSRQDDSSLIKLVAQIRPKETGKIESDPGFRRMHEVIQHVGIAMRLSAWTLEAAKEGPTLDASSQTLDQFANSNPEWETLQAMAKAIVLTHVGIPEPDDNNLPEDSIAEEDEQHRNVLRQHEYFLLYEEISYAMNHGDIGRVEASFIPWMNIFAGCGKHKYAAEMRTYLENVHFIYPKGLSRAIRMNILCNPSGEPGHFRAIDWIVEHNNLYTKRIYGGKFSNHTKDRIITESPLIETYKNVRIQFEDMFCLDHRTTRHSPANMKLTFAKLVAYILENRVMEKVKGRVTRYRVPDAAAKGIGSLLLGANESMATDEEDGGDGDEQVVDDGSLNL
ncbi:hypothetical protein FA15DRAFT_649673 [Coprinopsis marcescibilis]|uniref:DUF6589 domain-containing protein n=1 Tax=Coprinopsis marcescibilis TaxID=230819 RepID=A0A5C3KEZ8_COPMA|nr:hypothetical protein FA15DRAFT_649673 [Coprinopsis marcescibilis]